MIAIKQKYSATIKSVLNPKVNFCTGEAREMLDESFLIRVTVNFPSDLGRLNVTKGT